MDWVKTIRYPVEAWLVRLAAFAVPRLPRGGVLALSRAGGLLGYAAAWPQRRIGMANLDLAFGESISRAAKRRILRRSFQNFALVACDIFWFSRDVERKMRQHVRVPDIVGQSMRGKPNICVTGHMGNWELLGHVATLLGHPITSVANPIKNPRVDAVYNRMRQGTGQTIVKRQGAVRALIHALRHGGQVALLLDQNALLTEGGVFADFFGVPVTVSQAGAALAYRTGVDLLFSFCLQDGHGGYDVILPRVISPPPFDRANPDRPALELTRQITSVYEEQIRQRPECWLWMYKRWKHIRPGDAPGRYPFYSSNP